MNARLLATVVVVLAVFAALLRLGIGGADEGAATASRDAPETERDGEEVQVAVLEQDAEVGRAVAPSDPEGGVDPEFAGGAPKNPVPDVLDPAPPEDPGDAEVWLVGDVRATDGTPAAGRELRARLAVHRGMFGPEPVTGPLTTDDAGGFRYAVADAVLESGTPQTLELIDGEGEDAPRAIFVVPTHLAPGDHQLGTGAFAGPALLAAGTTRDLDGQVVAGATVSARWAHPVTIPPGADPAAFLPEVWWMLEGVEARSDAAGRFELRGFSPQPELKLEARREEYLDAEPVLVDVGDEAVDLVLPRGGGLRGVVLLTDAVPKDRVRVEVWRGDDFRNMRRVELEPDGAFVVEGLPPGPATVQVWAQREKLLIGEVEDVDLPSGRIGRDPRLDPLDLRDAACAAVLTVLDEAGDPVESPRGWVEGGRFPDEDFPGQLAELGPGRLLAVGLGRELDVTVWAAGYRAQRLEGVERDTEVRLAPAPTVRARVAAAPPLAEGRSFGLMLEVYDGDIPRQVSFAEVEPGVDVLLPASHEGRHRVSTWLILDPQGWSRGRVDGEPAYVDVDVGPDGVDVAAEVTVTEQALADLVEMMERFR